MQSDQSHGSGPVLRRQHRFRRRVLYAAAGCLLAVAATEGILRFGLGLGNPILIQQDQACAYILKPDQDVVRFLDRTHINHYGMRSDEVAASRNPGTLRVFFVGDSVTYGTTRVDQAMIFSEILHRELPAIVHRPVEVLNASAGGWAPDNELSYIRTRGIFQSDLVLLVLNDGDPTQPRATIADVGAELPQVRPATAIGELWGRYLAPMLLHYASKEDAGHIVAENKDALAQENLSKLDALNGIVKSQGGRLAVVFIPFRKDVPEISRQPCAILKTWTRLRGVPMFDLTSVVLAHSIDEIDLDAGLHLNAAGHRVIANAIESAWTQTLGGEAGAH